MAQNRRKVMIVIGSRSDLKQCGKGINALRKADKQGLIEFLGLHVCSAHRNPARKKVLAEMCITQKIDWVVTGAGKANQLTGTFDADLRSTYDDINTVVGGVAFTGNKKKPEDTLAAILSIEQVPGFQGIFNRDRHVGSEGFYNACIDAIHAEKPEITVPRAGENFDMKKAYELTRTKHPGIADHIDFIEEMEVGGLFHEYTGKVRETFSCDEFPNLLYFFQTSRISIFDRVLEALIKMKGEVLTATTVSFLTTTLADIPNHLVAYGSAIDEYLPKALRGRTDLHKSMLVVKKTKPLKVEAIVRGYLTGSGKKDYDRDAGMVCGIQLPEGLIDGSKLPEPIFTPSTKAEFGEHDVNIPFEEAEKIVGKKLAKQIRDITLEAYRRVHKELLAFDIIIADTKLEFGLDEDGNLIIIDETFTPDSSRFWPKDGRDSAMKAGETPPSLDKQPVRDAGIEAGFKTDNPGWIPSKELQNKTTANYLKMASIKFGKSLEEFQRDEMGIAA